MEQTPRECRVMNAANSEKVRFAQEQRAIPTVAEALLWRHLRKQQLGVKFRRQHPIEDFVLDFYCEEKCLAIEIDGPHHMERQEYDRYRDERMLARGIRTLRFSSEIVVTQTAHVLEAIRAVVSDDAALS